MRFVVVCPDCGPFQAITADEPDHWNEALLWGYLARQQHDREVHNEGGTMPRGTVEPSPYNGTGRPRQGDEPCTGHWACSVHTDGRHCVCVENASQPSIREPECCQCGVLVVVP